MFNISLVKNAVFVTALIGAGLLSMTLAHKDSIAVSAYLCDDKDARGILIARSWDDLQAKQACVPTPSMPLPPLRQGKQPSHNR